MPKKPEKPEKPAKPEKTEEPAKPEAVEEKKEVEEVKKPKVKEKRAPKKKKIQKKISALYKIEGKNLRRVIPFCERCGPGYFMADHGNRFSCGHCGFTRYKTPETAGNTGLNTKEPANPSE